MEFNSPKFPPTQRLHNELGNPNLGSPAPGIQLPNEKNVESARPKSHRPVNIKPESLKTVIGIFHPDKLDMEP
jgi:hypothetical protein